MTETISTDSPIRAGDIDGLGRIYSEFGGPFLRPKETVIAHREGCDLSAYRSWRTLFPKRIFHPLPGKPSGTIHVTSERLIFLRNIDIWREVKPLLTPLGLPTAAEKESKLKGLKAKGARQYCEVRLSQLRLVHATRRPWFLRCRLISEDGGKYEIFLRTDADDSPFLEFLERAIRQYDSQK